ncbi:type II secretion system protein [Sulfurimonas sp.]|uniref:pilus assembly FimT family protein n=1 Tax=Sulfurimonas sp. TaxID=2022749 RepID=UPI00263512C4|nr:type II secretion system protein [Sulfurimonas sp.]MDD3855513.1 type II secretion system protein [Sulfurimonas sp.]
MKKAFTMMELVFVIVVIGILAAVVMPRTGSNRLNEAAIQVVSHIRYTQHLAMIDDKFDSADNDWYRLRWQIKFSKVGGSDNKWAYAIFSDADVGSGHDGNPNDNETAVNPLDNSKKLTGGYSGTIEYGDSKATKELNLGHSYSVEDIDLVGGCNISNDGKKRISFDYLGRLMYENPKDLDSSYKAGAINRLVISQCRIEICTVSDCTAATSEQKVTIAIEPETGYAHIL